MARVEALGGLRPGLDIDHAAAIADVLIDPMPYRRLVIMRRWKFADFVAYQQHAAAASLLA